MSNSSISFDNYTAVTVSTKLSTTSTRTNSSTICEAREKILSQFQKSFIEIDHQWKLWENSFKEAELDVHVKILSNLIDNAQSCQNANLGRANLIKHFPDIREKLLFKIERDIEEEKDLLSSLLKTLQNIYSSVSSQCDNSFKIFEKYKLDLSSVAETQKTEVWPSISQMLQWLKELEKAFENECLVREFVLENMDLHEPSTTENLMKIWCDYSKLRILVNDVMTFVSFFIQADLTKIS
ncbi:uncharacterized protein C1orf109 homolog [Limulus polyphemus]|uniref:Uncharacterized protein C1orf109 homolog n=1 Tax=Limulus polyphemus TaxID=6850 RepID=A0ABM1B6V1_LIMPO|nr:uncharacterized protein C1orf109 homolog [Limulus polyphemus]